MRCYLMRRGHIGAVEFLTEGPDSALIAQARDHFFRRKGERFDGFEVWDGARRVYCHPENAGDASPEAGSARDGNEAH